MGVPLRLFSAAKKSWCRYFQGTSVSSGKNYFIIAPAIGLKSFKTSIAGTVSYTHLTLPTRDDV